MLLTILAITALAVIVLIGLYLLSRRIPTSGECAAFPCILIARPLVQLQWFAEDAAGAFHLSFQKSMNYPPQVTGEAWYGLYVIARNVLFIVCSIILTGDLYNNLQSLPLLFGGAGGVDFGVSFAIPAALLFVLTGALYGYVGLDCTGATPYGTHLFGNMTDKVKKWLGIACLVGFILSVIFAVSFWAFRGWYLAYLPTDPNSTIPDNSGWLVISILGLVGLLLSGSFVLSLWGLVVGLTGVFTVVFWLLYCAFTIVAGAFSLIPSLLDVAVLYLTDGQKSVYGKFIGHDPYKVPASPFPIPLGSSPSQTPTVVLPDPASNGHGDIVLPIATPEPEKIPLPPPVEKKPPQGEKRGVSRSLEIKFVKKVLPLSGEQETIEPEQANGKSHVSTIEPGKSAKKATRKAVTPSRKIKASVLPAGEPPGGNGHINTERKTTKPRTKKVVSTSRSQVAPAARRGRSKTTPTTN